MNIDEYRALKAQQSQPEVEEIVEPTVEETKPVEVEETKVEEPKPTTVVIDGVELDIEELKNGYLRQSDYTKKTQDVARQKKESEEAINFYEYLKANPDVVKDLQKETDVPTQLDPTQSKVIELENKMYDMMLQKEIETLQGKYDDFEIREVLDIAKEKKIVDLEDAYLLLKSKKSPSQSVEEMKKQIRTELLEEMKKEGESTKSIINDTASDPVESKDAPTLSPQEVKVAKGMGMSIEDYVKWREIK